MTTFSIENDFNSFPDDIENIFIHWKGVTYIPDLKRFTNLKELYCSSGDLTYLPDLPNKLERLYCHGNKLTYLPKLPETLKVLQCDHNQLGTLPELPKNLYSLFINDNNLYCLPELPESIKNLHYYNYRNNPIEHLLDYGFSIDERNLQFKNLKNCCHEIRLRYYALKFKKQFRDWLWLRVREQKVKKLYHPNHLDNLKEEDDLDTFFNNWVSKE